VSVTCHSCPNLIGRRPEWGIQKPSEPPPPPGSPGSLSIVRARCWWSGAGSAEQGRSGAPTTLHCTALHYTTLHYTGLHHTTLHCTTPHYASPQYATPHYTTVHHTTVHHSAPHHSAPQCTTPQCTTVHPLVPVRVPSLDRSPAPLGRAPAGGALQCAVVKCSAMKCRTASGVPPPFPWPALPPGPLPVLTLRPGRAG
jgi:hypothetical protein